MTVEQLSAAQELWECGAGTVEIAEDLGLTEAEVANGLAGARDGLYRAGAPAADEVA